MTTKPGRKVSRRKRQAVRTSRKPRQRAPKAGRKRTRATRVSKKVGRKSKYTRRVPAKAKKLAKKGGTDKEILAALRIGKTTFYRWQEEHREFREALKAGKETADQDVEAALYRRAVGYDLLEVTSEPVGEGRRQKLVVTKTVTKHIPPDPASMIFWLKNRMPKTWRDIRDLRHHEVPLNDDPFEGIQADKREEALERFESIFPMLRLARARLVGSGNGAGKEARR